MSYLGSVEFFVVILFGLGWAILEFVGRRLDKKRERKTDTNPR